jgi:hypothetical protein
VVNKARHLIIIIRCKTINNNIRLVQWCISQVWWRLIINHHRNKIPLLMEHHLNIKTDHHLNLIPWCKEVQVFKETLAWWDLHKIICQIQTNVHHNLWCKMVKAYWFSRKLVRKLVNIGMFLNLLCSITTCNHNNNSNSNNKYHVPKLKKKWKTQSTQNQNYKI